jgi:hypothetical protein
VLEDRINRVAVLLAKREEINNELAQLLGVEPKAKRGRPRADAKEKDGTPPVPSNGSAASA